MERKLTLYYTDAPRLTMGLNLNKPIVSRKYFKSKMHLLPHCRVSVVYPHDHMADWELGSLPLLSFLPHIVCQGKDQNSEFKVGFLLNVYHFRTAESQKFLSQTIVNQGPSA